MESTLQSGVHNPDSLCDDRREFAGYPETPVMHSKEARNRALRPRHKRNVLVDLVVVLSIFE
jgi:hypothetical protein